jgi:effector-binding domain-containing protein
MVVKHIAKNGMEPAGAPYAMYFNMDMENLEVEAGFPVEKALPGEGEVISSTIPGGEVASTIHKGSFDTLEQSYTALTSFVKEQNKVPTGICYEVYLSDPETTKPEDMLTELVYLLK